VTSKKTPLFEALDGLVDGCGELSVDLEQGRAEIEVLESGRLGVRVQRLGLSRSRDVDVLQEAESLPSRLKSLPERVLPVEVDARLAGAVLRTEREAVRGGEFFEVELRGTRDIDIRRFKVQENGDRQVTDWTMTREQLEKIFEEMG
jgi:hypothetical protein